ncbi:MAG: AMP-binding protein [Microthrixaceae bacterium]|nr:AMP-binding protein [Microthrixaceae bacterium]
MLLHEIISFAASAGGNRTALVSDGVRWSFSDLNDQVIKLGQRVRQLTSPGDRVVIISENTPQMVAAIYGVPLAGAIATFANTRHTVAEVMDLISATDPSLLLISDHMDKSVGNELRSSLSLLQQQPVLASLDSPEAVTGADESLGEAQEPTGDGPGSVLDSSGINESDCAWLIHTSGTTGRPKGVMLSHRSLLAATINTAIGRPMQPDDVYMMPFPLFHVAAYNVLHAHLRGRPVVLMSGFEAGQALDLIVRESVTVCSLAPTMLAMLLDHPDRPSSDLSGLRQISYGASSMPLDLLLRVSRELPGCGLAQGYGMTELSGNAVFLTPEDHRIAVESDPDLLAAAGQPGPLVEIRIVGDDDKPLSQGSAGEILVRGDQVCSGYWNAPEETALTIRDGWLHTGDVGLIDANGYLHVVDRKKDIIITGGENVASREVEDLLSVHPAIDAVAVIGLPDSQWGELVCAVVVTTAGSDSPLQESELVEWTRGRIAGFKRPRRVFMVDELPLNASGKVDKPALRTRFGI